MKKQLICMTAIAALMMTSATAFASTTVTSETGGYNVTTDAAASKKTVLITNDSDDSIVYVGQSESDNAYTSATEFLLKAGAADGAYTIKLGSDTDAEAQTAKFAIGVGIEDYDTELTALTPEASGDKYNWSFVTPEGGVTLKNSAIILVKTSEGIMAYPVDNKIHLEGPGNVVLGVQINDVSTNAENSVKVYLRQGANVE